MIFLIGNGCVSVTPVYYDEDKKIVESQIKKFHELYNEENFKEMYEMNSLETKKVVTQEEFIKKFKQTRSELGKVLKSKIIKAKVKPQASSRLVEFVYETTFENGKVKELFICSTNGKESVIEVYNQPK